MAFTVAWVGLGLGRSPRTQYENTGHQNRQPVTTLYSYLHLQPFNVHASFSADERTHRHRYLPLTAIL